MQAYGLFPLLIYRLNDFVDISTIEGETGALLCGRMEDFSVLVPADQVHISFFARGKYEWGRGDGFKASYLGVKEKPTGIFLLIWLCNVVQNCKCPRLNVGLQVATW